MNPKDFRKLNKITGVLDTSLQNLNASLIQRIIHLDETISDAFAIFDKDLNSTAQTQELGLKQAQSQFDQESSITLFNQSIVIVFG